MSIWSFLTKLNGNDESTYGLEASELKGPWDSPSASFSEVAIPGREGATPTVTKPIIATKDFTATYRLKGSSEQDYENKVDALRDLWGTSATFIVGSQETRQRTGLITDIRVISDPDVQAGSVELDVHCSDPIAYETSATTTTGSSGADVAMPLGRWTSRPVITVGSSPSSPLVLTYKNYAGTTIGTPMTIEFPGSPSSIVIDCDAQTILRGGTRHDEDLTAGDFITLDPHDGSYSASHWPTLRISSGSLSAVYTKRYP